MAASEGVKGKLHLCFIPPLLLMAAAFFLRLHLNNSGLPGTAFLRHDELHYARRVLGFLNGDFDVHYFINPSLYMYVLFAAVSLAGRISVMLGDAVSFEEFKLLVTFNPCLILVLGRAISIAASALSVGVLYSLGRRLFNRPVAFVASAALAFNFTHALRAPLAGNESLMVLGILLFLLLLDRYRSAPTPLKHAACGFVLGLAGSVKYNALIHVIPLAAVTLFIAYAREKPARGSGLARALVKPRYCLGFLFLLLGFFAGSPFALLNFGDFIHGFYTQYSFLNEGYTGFEGMVRQSGFFYYMAAFPLGNNGLVFSLFCALGIVGAVIEAIRKRDSRLVLLLFAALPLYFFMGTGVFNRMRFFLPAIPLILLCGAWGFVQLLDHLLRFLAPPGRMSERKRQILFHGAWISLSALMLAPGAYRTHQTLNEAFGGIDPMGEVVALVKEKIPPGEKTLELAYPLNNAYPESTAMLDRFGYKEQWFNTGEKREAFERFKESLHTFKPLGPLIRRSASLEELMNRIEGEGFRYLLLYLSPMLIPIFKDLPDRTGDPDLKNCRYWKDLLKRIAQWKLLERRFTRHKEHTLLLYELK